MEYAFEITTQPTAEPITVEAAKRQCSIEVSETHFDDWFGADVIAADKIPGAIGSARALVESDARVRLMPQTGVLRFPSWEQLVELTRRGAPEALDLREHPVRAIASVKYYDGDDVQQTLSAGSYQLLRSRFRSYIASTLSTSSLPSFNTARALPIEITLTLGYSIAADSPLVQRAAVPPAAAMAIKMLLGHWFKNRESVLTGTISKEIEQGYLSLINTIRPRRYR